MMLQTIDRKKEVARASSIYCRWIRSEQREGSPLVAVWIDSEMRAFEGEFAGGSEAQPLEESALEEPGRRVAVESPKYAVAIEIPL